MSWETELATQAKPIEAKAPAADTPEMVWVRENAATNDFARSLLDGFKRYGQLTDRQAEAVRRILNRVDSLKSFHKEHAAEIAWIRKNSQDNSFAASLWMSLEKYGTLTERQLAAVQRNISDDAARNAVTVNHASTWGREQAVSQLDISSLPAGRYAVPDGDTRLKVLVSKPTKGSYKGWIFVSDAAAYGQRRRYGSQNPATKMYVGEIREQLQKIIEDPRAATIAYGRLTGTCGVCGRPLEDEASVAAGIGPICAGRL